MIYLKRKVDSYLLNWKTNPIKKPLIIKGSRQVGKTESITRFGHQNYKSVVYINFVEEPNYKMITSDGYKAQDIIKNISRIDPSKQFLENETLIIFDELQDFPEIATSLKFFQIDGRFDVICSGSLLGINYQRIESNAVGYKTDYEMFSLDFEEFLWAKEYDESTIQEMLEHMIQLKPFNEIEMSIYSFEGSIDIQKQLVADYKEDIRKYADGMDQTRITNVFDHIPVQLAKDNKKFQITKVASNARFRDYRGCIEWLKDAGIINICYCMQFPELPLKGNYDETKFKIYFADSGLLVSMLDDEAQEDLRVNKNLGVYKGALYENIVGEALVKAGYGLYYYKKENSTLEQDFFVRNKENLIPVEVKASNGTARSLRTLINSDHYPDIQFGIKFISGNIGLNNNIYTFPYFCAFLLKKYLTKIS